MTAALSLRGLGKDFGERTAVRAIDLDVVRGECLGLLGPNGAGKTTAISMACGVVTPTRGTVTIGGIELRGDPHAAKAKLGLVPQELAIYEELSARQNLAYFGALYGLAGALLGERIGWALDVVGLRDRASEPVKRYSGGMKRRCNLAAGLLHKPELLILDEPTVGVDPQSRNHIFETVRALRKDGMTVIYTSHYMEEVEALCDRVAIMDDGAIAATGTVAELIANHAGKGIELVLAAPGSRRDARDAAVSGAVFAALGKLDSGPAADAASVERTETAAGAGVIDAAVAAATAHASVERTGDTLRVVPTAGLAPVIAAIEGAGATIARIQSREATLETAFLALTGKTLRDEASA